MSEVKADRRVLHCDMDCFYAAVHMRDDPTLAGKPVVIGGSPEGRGVVAAASYEARRFGIRSALPAARAVRLCPQAIFIRPDFNRYREESQYIVEIFRDFTPVVQKVSIDEAYLDVTDQLEPRGSATAVAKEIKRRVREERGLTVSVGVGPNRLVAKIASDFDKPDGLTVVKPARVQAFLDVLSVRTLPGVGPASERRLLRSGIETIADLRAVPRDRLEMLFGKHGQWLYNCARGIDERPVRTHRERKSLSCERTYAKDLQRLEEMDQELERMAERVGRGLKKRELSAQTVTIKVRYGDFTTLTRSYTLPSPTSDEQVMATWAYRLLRKTEAGRRSVRLLGLGAGNLVHGEMSQLELF
ncbi:MAG: DNA polymerase IV [Thermoanaerobaculia bacterium]